MGYQLETTALISINNYNAFRITRIMLILTNLQNTLFKLVDNSSKKSKIHKSKGDGIPPYTNRQFWLMIPTFPSSRVRRCVLCFL